MTVTRLYHPHPIECGQTIQLDKNASHHLARVLRSKKNSVVTLFNGNGLEYSSILIDDNPKQCTVLVKTENARHRESPVHITLLQGISRGDRMDICIQKSTELGVNTIIPVICERSTGKPDKSRSEKKHAHWKQVMISACEQSGRCVIPELLPASTYKELIASIDINMKFVLDPVSGSGLKTCDSVGDNICILSGPEGGLTTNEIRQACDNDFQAIQLGPRILRTETAAPACISAIQTLWGDLG